MDEGTAHLGTIKEVDEGYELYFERHFEHPAEKVWAALSDPDLIEEWLAKASRMELTSGGAVELRWQNTDAEGNHAIARGQITRLDPPTMIEYDTDIHGLIRWEIEPRGDNCLLKLTVRHDLPDDFVAIVLAGWHVHIDFLDDALAGNPIDWSDWPMDRWEVHHEIYRRHIG